MDLMATVVASSAKATVRTIGHTLDGADMDGVNLNGADIQKISVIGVDLSKFNHTSALNFCDLYF